MAQPYVGEIRMFAGNFQPNGWMFCDGQELPISENETLFQLIGTTYGGDGQTTFRLPDLRGRVPVHFGSSSRSGNHFQLAEAAGVEEVTLTVNQIPAHTHTHLVSAAPASTDEAPGRLLATSATDPHFVESGNLRPLDPRAVQSVGGSQPHTNLQPYLCLNFIISLFGIFPSPS